MRVAFFSPLPPARSGIADYSEALIESLRQLVESGSLFLRRSRLSTRPGSISRLYQVGNNAHHDFVYETALRHPGVVVMHESNLHHLMTDLTIRRGDWDAYVARMRVPRRRSGARLCASACASWKWGPITKASPMTRRLLENARGVVVHSQIHGAMRSAPPDIDGPVAVIPHGAWIPRSRPQWRTVTGWGSTRPRR